MRVPVQTTTVLPLRLVEALWCAVPSAPRAGIQAILAHSHFETAAWKGCRNWNLGNAKAHRGWTGDVTHYMAGETIPVEHLAHWMAQSSERTDGGDGPDLVEVGRRQRGARSMVTVRAYPDHPLSRFRAFASLERGVEDYVTKLRDGRYRAAWDRAMAGDLEGFGRLLHSPPDGGPGYYTAAPELYLRGMAASMEATAGVIPPDSIADRDEWLLEHDPDDPDWTWVTVTPLLRVRVSRGPLSWDGVAMAGSAVAQQLVADSLRAVMMTPRIADRCAEVAHEGGGLHTFRPRPITSRTLGYLQHSADLRARSSGSTGVLAGWKDRCISRDIWSKRGRVTNYGGHADTSHPWYARLSWTASPTELRVIEPDTEAHPGTHGDYSELMRVVHRTCEIRYSEDCPFQAADLADVYVGTLGPELADAATGEGALPGWRLPGVEPLVDMDTTDSTPRITRPGERGADVVAWQTWLMGAGYDLPRYGADGDHGAETEDATQLAMRESGLVRDGDPAPEPVPVVERVDSVGAPTLNELVTSTAWAPATHYTAGRPLGSPRWIVIHTAETGELPHGAEALGAYLRRGADGRSVSWHFAVDADSTVQSVRLEDVAWTQGPGNEWGISIELAGRASQTSEQWADEYSRAQLGRLRELLRALSAATGIPLVRLDSLDLLAARSGVCGHMDVSGACVELRRRPRPELGEPWYRDGRLRMTTHGDPGHAFPWAMVL